MPPSDVTSLQRMVIVAGPSQLARHSIEEAAEAAERLGQRAAATFHGARVQEQQQIQAARDTQMELEAHLILVGLVWLGWVGGWVSHTPREGGNGEDVQMWPGLTQAQGRLRVGGDVMLSCCHEPTASTITLCIHTLLTSRSLTSPPPPPPPLLPGVLPPTAAAAAPVAGCWWCVGC